MGFNLGTLHPQLHMEIVKDIMNERKELDIFTRFCDVRPTSTRKGEMYIWNTALEVASDGHRTSEVAPGANTPKGESDLKTITYECRDFKFMQGIEKGALKEIQNVDDVRNKLANNAIGKVMLDFNKKVAALLKGQDAVHTITENPVTTAWSDPTAKVVDDLDAVLKKMRGLGAIKGVFGYDVMLNLSKNQQLTGAAAGSGREYLSFDEALNWLRSRGVSEIIVDGTIVQNGEMRFARDYTGVYEGVAALTCDGNILVPNFQDLESTSWEDPDCDTVNYKAKHTKGLARGYEEHTQFFSGI